MRTNVASCNERHRGRAPSAVLGHRGHHPLLDIHLHAVRFRMCTEATRRERAEKRPSQVGALGHDIDRSGEIPQAEADLATLPGFQCLLGALSLRSRKGKPRPQLGTYRRSEERIGVASSRQRIIKAKSPPDRPMQARSEMSGPCDDERKVATESSHQEQAFHASFAWHGPHASRSIRQPGRFAEPREPSP